MNYPTLCKLIAAAVFLSVLVRWRAFTLIGGLPVSGMSIVIDALMLATLALALAGVVGLWRTRRWGFVAFYPFAVLFTLVFGASLVPFVPVLLPAEARVAGVFAVNGILLALVALVHRRHPG
jgi:hypothetical protein